MSVVSSGFVYLTSNGSSSRHAGQFQLRRRLRNGLAASVQYTLAKATDNATAFAGVNLSGGAIAQDWRDLDAEQAPSNFDQRHQVTAQFQYTTGVGVAGGALLDGMKGALLQRLDGDEPAHDRQRSAVHAGLSRARSGNRRHRIAAPEPDGRDR